MKKLQLLIPALLFFCSFSQAQTPSLVYDIYPGGDAAYPDHFAVFNGKLYFQADEGLNGTELWQYSGSGNPSLVADIQPGGAFTSSNPQALTPFDGALYFTADDGTNGFELWKYDGVSAPTMIVDLYPGFFYGVSAIKREMTVYKNNLYFQGNDGTAGGELYRYDGVSSSPVIAADIAAGTNGSLPASFAVYHDTLYFVADNGTSGTELWKFDGTTASLAADIVAGSGSSAPAELTVFNNKLYFTANDGVTGTELWVYDDATQSANLVHDINSGAGYAFSLAASLTEFNGKLYFTADDGIDGAELWVYDGVSTPSLVEDIFSGIFNGSFPTNYMVYDGELYFAATDGTYGQELRKYTGSGSVQLVYDLNPGSDGAFITGPIVFNNAFYFGGDNGFSANGHELWTFSTFCTPTFNTQTITSCTPYTWSVNGQTYFSSTTAYDTLINAAGCDSVLTLNLTIPMGSVVDDFIDTCDSYIWRDGITYTSNNNTAVHTIQDVNGCDSIMYFLNLTIRNSISTVDTRSVCDSLIWIDGNTYYASNNSATVSLTAANGCDSVVTLNLTINPSYHTTDTLVACDSLVWTDGNTYYTNNNSATQTLTSSMGCDSIIQLNLTITTAQFTSMNETACASYISPSGHVWDSTGVYTDTIMTTAGCDSIITVNLTVLQPSSVSIQDTACGSYLSPSGQLFDFTSIFTDTIPNSVGCDSVITIHLFMKDPDVSTTLACNTLTANESGATYQWIDCDNGGSTIAGATSQSFTPGDDGNYAVIVTKNGCADTSSCTSITLFRILGEQSDFFEKPNVPFVGVQYSNIGFADVDGDQDQDVLIMGATLPFKFCKLYINDGDGNFTEKTGIPFDGIAFGGFDFADLDGDQDLDIIINGTDINNDPMTQLYLNDGSGNYSVSSGTSFIGLGEYATVNFADVDGDLDQDVLLTGDTTTGDPNNGATVLLYINNGNGNFTLKSNTPFLGVSIADVAFADVDGDQDMDVLITGDNDGLARSTTLYINDGNGDFTIKNTSFIQVSGEVVFADVDGDQDQDVFISGREGHLTYHPVYTNLYINDGSGNYTLQNGTPFSAVTVASLSVADVDQDQDQDLLITGADDDNLNSKGIAALYLNDGNGNYSLKDSTPFVGVINADAAFADVNGDQKLDLLIAGNEGTVWNFSAGTTRLYMAYNSASTNGNILVANPISPVDSYQWIDCATNEPIPGATDSIFVAATNGSYAVIVTSENCVNTSECYTVSGVTGVENLIHVPSIAVYPNPSTGVLVFESISMITSIEITDINGRVVKMENMTPTERTTLDITDATAGVYFFHVMYENGEVSRGKVIKQ